MKVRMRMLQTNEALTFIALLLVLVFIALGGNLWATFSYAQHQKQQAAQQKATSQQIFTKVCNSFNRVARLAPPSIGGTDKYDLAVRAYLHSQHDVLASLGPDIHCPASTVGGR